MIRAYSIASSTVWIWKMRMVFLGSSFLFTNYGPVRFALFTISVMFIKCYFYRPCSLNIISHTHSLGWTKTESLIWCQIITWNKTEEYVPTICCQKCSLSCVMTICRSNFRKLWVWNTLALMWQNWHES